jgi:hypothetical protein
MTLRFPELLALNIPILFVGTGLISLAQAGRLPGARLPYYIGGAALIALSAVIWGTTNVQIH